MALTAVEGQMIEQLKWTAENVCSTYHVPPYKIGVGAQPTYNNVQSLNVEYYSQCLQSLLEDAESCLDDGLGLGDQYDLGVEFDIDNLLRMDTASQADATTKLVGGSILTPNEGRKRFNQKPLEGGDTVYMQQQNYSLEALAKRDAQEDPFGTKAPPPAAAAPPPADPAAPPADREGGCQQSGARTAEVAPPACSRLKSRGWANERDGPGGCHRACLARTRRCHHWRRCSRALRRPRSSWPMPWLRWRPGPTSTLSLQPEFAKAMADQPKVPTAAEVAALVPAPQDGKDADPAAVAAIVTAEVEKAMADRPIVTAEEVAFLVPKPADGKSVTEDVRPLVDEMSRPRSQDGKDVDPTAVAALGRLRPEKPMADRPMVTAEAVEVHGAQAGRRQERDGSSEVRPLVDEIVAAKVAAIPLPRDGKDVEPEAVLAMVAEAVEACPRPGRQERDDSTSCGR